MKDFIEYQEALELKQLGFNEPCFGSWEVEKTNIPTYTHSVTKFYKNSDHPIGKTSAPTYSQAFRFFRENYPHLNFGFDKIHSESENYHYHINYKWEFFEGSYEEAELACLRRLIEIVK